MLNVALTGNIGAGKSTVLELFRRWGATVIDADRLARDAQAPGTEVLARIAQRFGADVLAPDGTLDRAALRGKVIGDDVALGELNRIVHPAVIRRREELQEQARLRGDALLVNDIPLLFEVLDPAQFDVVVLVDATVAVRRDRLTHRGLAPQEADRMIAAQMPAERKRPRSHAVIENDGTLAELEARARGAFEQLRGRAAVEALGCTGRSLVVVTASARDQLALVRAVMARYADAGVAVQRASGKTPTLLRTLQRARPPVGAVLVTAAAAEPGQAAWDQAGRPGVLLYAGPDPDPVAVRLDLRPWGHDPILVAQHGGLGLAPRADLFPRDNPLA